jgi:hypothetical protein
MPSTPVSRRSAITTIGLVGLALPGVLACGSSQTPTPQQPHMQAALDALRNAKRHLDLAEADKGGHRVRALELVNGAITETEAGMAYAAGH